MFHSVKGIFGLIIANVENVHAKDVHSMERTLNLLAFFRGLVDGLIKDMQLIKPPAFIAVPRIFQRVQSQILNGIEAKSWLAKKLFWYAFEQKKKAILARKDLSN